MNTNLFDVPWYLLVLMIVLLAISILTLHKTRRIHLATYDLLNDLRHSRKEIEALFAQIQAFLALERKLALADPLPPMRGWAGSPDFLLTIANTLFERRPKVVMECSSGVSTLVIARCLQQIGGGHVYSLEHDAKYAARTARLLEQHHLSDWATVLDAPLASDGTGTPWYSEDAIPATQDAIDVLVVDGPPTSCGPLARLPALPRLAKRLAQGALIIVDDADRPDEAEMISRWQRDFPVRTTIVPCEKGCAILEFDQR